MTTLPSIRCHAYQGDFCWSSYKGTSGPCNHPYTGQHIIEIILELEKHLMENSSIYLIYGFGILCLSVCM